MRLDEDAREALDLVAKRWGLPRSAAVARLAIEAATQDAEGSRSAPTDGTRPKGARSVEVKHEITLAGAPTLGCHRRF